MPGPDTQTLLYFLDTYPKSGIMRDGVRTPYPGVEIGGILYPVAGRYPEWKHFYDQDEIVGTQARLNELHLAYRPEDYDGEAFTPSVGQGQIEIRPGVYRGRTYEEDLKIAKGIYNDAWNDVYKQIQNRGIRSISTVDREMQEARFQFGSRLESAIEYEVERQEERSLKRKEQQILRDKEEAEEARRAEEKAAREAEKAAIEESIRQAEEARKAAEAAEAEAERIRQAEEDRKAAAAEEGGAEEDRKAALLDEADEEDEADAFEEFLATLPVDPVTGVYDTNPIDPVTGERMYPDLTEGLGGPATGASFAGSDDWWVERWRALQAGDTAAVEALESERANYSCAPGFNPRKQNGVWVCVNNSTHLPESFAVDERAALVPEPPPPVDEVLNLSEEEINQAIIDRSLTDEEIEVLIEADRFTDQQMHNLRQTGRLTEQQIADFNEGLVLDRIDQYTDEQLQRLIAQGTFSDDTIRDLIDDGTISEGIIEALVADGTLSDDEADSLLFDRPGLDDELTDDELTDDELTDDELTDDELTDDEFTDDEFIDYELTDDELNALIAEGAILSEYITLEELEERLGEPLTLEELEAYGYADDAPPDEEVYLDDDAPPDDDAPAEGMSYDELVTRLEELEEQLANSETQYEADATRNQRDQTREELDEYFAAAQPSGPRTGTTSEFQVRGGANPISSLIAFQQDPGVLNPEPYIPTYTPSYSDWEAPMSIDRMGEYRGPGPMFDYSDVDPLWYVPPEEEFYEEEEEFYEGEEDEFYEEAAGPDTGAYNQGGQVMQPQQSTMFNQNSILDQRPGQTNQGILGALNFQTNVAPFQNAFRPNVTRNN
jgi:hypothetical protein